MNNLQKPNPAKPVSHGLRFGLSIVIGIFLIIPTSIFLLRFFGPPVVYVSKRIWFNHKARSDNRDDIYEAANQLYRMRRSYEDVDLANKWYEIAAEKGHPEAVCLMANTESWDFYDKKWMAIGVQLKIEGCLILVQVDIQKILK
jgi:hypothetical protein